MVHLLGGSEPHDTQKLVMVVFVGINFVEFEVPTKSHSATRGLWWGRLEWRNLQGTRETVWRAYSDSEAVEVMEGMQAALLRDLARMEERFQTWHDVLPYLNKNIRDALDPPGQVNEYRLPKV